jgi:phage terminase small subunit
MPSNKLTPKQERFCKAYIETGNATEAYRQAYSAKNMKDSSINVNACKMFKNTKIALRLAGITKEHQDRHNITVDTLTERQLRIYDKHWEETPAAAVSAINSVAKLHGLGQENVKFKGKFEHNVTDIKLGFLTK